MNFSPTHHVIINTRDLYAEIMKLRYFLTKPQFIFQSGLKESSFTNYTEKKRHILCTSMKVRNKKKNSITNLNNNNINMTIIFLSTGSQFSDCQI